MQRLATRMTTVSKYYLDESGNTGDLIRAGNRFEFARQPVFVLACIGTDDSADLAEEIARLKARYKVQASELKSGARLGKPLLVSDILHYLRRHNLPVLIEVVEKRFFICMNIVERLVTPPVGAIDLEPRFLALKNIFADYLRHCLPDDVLHKYVAACEAPSALTLRTAFTSVKGHLLKQGSNDEIAIGILRFLVDSEREFEEMGPTTPAAQSRFLPVPDNGKTGRPLWMLPNLSSFTNIYARINQLHERNVSNITLVHDEQFYFERILQDGKVATEALIGMDAVPAMPHADFGFNEAASLVFARSDDSPGIQVADVIAGFVMRYVKAVLFNEPGPHPELHDVFHELLSLSVPSRGIGINFVLTHHDLARLGVSIA